MHLSVLDVTSFLKVKANSKTKVSVIDQLQSSVIGFKLFVAYVTIICVK